MAEILITGSKGVIGTVLSEGLEQAGYHIRSFDLPEDNAVNREHLTERMTGCRAVIHLAWNTKIENHTSGRADPKNLLMAQNVYSAAIRTKCQRLIIASSIHADMPKRRAMANRSPYHLPAEPDSPYGQSKLRLEAIGRNYAKRGLGVVCVRFGWVSPDVNDRPRPPYPHNEGWLSHNDCVDLAQACLEAYLPENYAIIYGLSKRLNGGIHDLTNPFGWEPQDSYEA